MDDAPTCPLCAEELDAADRGFFPCRCGYQVCPFCYERIKESSNPVCPACRASYSDQEPRYEEPDLDKINRDREEQKQRDRAAKQESSRALESLANVRVIQRNLVYVTGLPLKHAYDEVLAGPKWFKPYGKIIKCVANRSVQYNTGSPHGPTVSAYVTFSNHNEALNAIKHLDNTVQDGHVLRCSFGTTKYCNSFLQGRECTIPDCMYLHKIQETEDTYLRAQLSKGQDSRSRAEFHDKTHPQFMQAQQEQARPPEVKLHTEYRPNNRDHSNQSVALPAPLPRASSVNSKRGSQEQASSRTAMAQPAIPIPRPAAPKQLQAPKQQQVSPPAIAAIGMRDKGTSKAGSDGSAPSVSNSDPVVPNEPSSAPRIAPGMAWDCAAEPPKVRADNNLPSAVAPTDQVASAASAALSSDSLFSAFANSQHQQQQPGTAGVVGDQLWGQDWGGQSNANPTGQVFGGPAGFSLWGNTPAAAPAPLGMGGSVDPWRTAPNNEPMPAPQAQPQDWQSAFRALLPDVNVHFESSVPPQPQQPSNLPVAAANSNQNESGNIWGAGFAPFGSPTAEQQSGANNGTSDSSFATTWNLPAMLQPPGGSDALGSNSNEANSLWQSGAFGISVPNLPAPQPLESSGDRTAATNSSGNNINSGNNGNGGSNRRTRGGKKRGGKNKNNS